MLGAGEPGKAKRSAFVGMCYAGKYFIFFSVKLSIATLYSNMVLS